MATIPVYLTDENGDVIVGGDDLAIIVGYISSTLFVGSNGENLTSELPGGGTTFLEVINAATPEAKAEVLRGLRLAKSIRGRLSRFEIGEGASDFYVKYNHSIFGGRFQSAYTALGSIAGTYLRRGGSAFTKELVEAALVTGPYANFPSTFPSIVLPGDVALSVTAGGGTPTAFTWTFDNGVDQPTTRAAGASISETLTEGTWTVSCVVAFDGGDSIIVEGQTLEVAVFSAASMSPSTTAPALGDIVTFSLAGMQNPSLAQSSEWAFTSAPTKVEVNLSQSDTSFRSSTTAIDIPLIEGVDYEIVSQTATSADVRFLTGGEFHASATIRHSDDTTAVAFSSVDVVPTGSFGTLTDNSRMSVSTADALYQGDTHVVVLGDSLMNPFVRDRLAEGIRTQWKPARWAGLQHGVSQIGSGLYYARSGSQTDAQGSANINRDGTNSSGAQITGTEVATAQYSPLASGRGEWTLDAGTLSNAVRARVKQSGETVEAVGRLQGTDTFDNVSGTQTSMLLVGVDTGLTLDVSSPGTVEAASVTLTADQYATVATTWNPTGSSDQEPLALGWTGQSAGDKFGVIDIYTYNPNISGLSVSYMGDGGWNIANHAGPYALNENGVEDVSTHANPDEWYDDRAIEEHLKLYAYSDFAQTQLRDNIIIIIENQNGTSYGYSNAVRLALNAVRSRWETAANNLDPSGTLWSRIQFVFMTLPELYWAESHESFAAQARDFIGVGGYDWCELIDLNQQLLEYAPGDGLDYSDPKTYTDIYWNHDGNNATPRELLRSADVAEIWYGYTAQTQDDGNGGTEFVNGDMVHPTQAGSYVAMSEFWKIVEATASSSQLIGGNVTAEPVLTQLGDAIEFDVDGITGDTDRVIVWLDQNGTEVARGENPILNTLDASVTRVDARIITADGGDTTLVGPSITINNVPTISSQLAIDGGTQPVTGTSYDLIITATDVNGDDLTYTLSNGTVVGPLSSGVEASFTLTAGAEAVDQVFTCDVTDGNGGSVTSSSVTVTPGSANQPPAISFPLNVNTTNGTQVGSSHSITAFFITDPEDAVADLLYEIQFSTDSGANWSLANGTTTSGSVTVTSNGGTATGSHVPASAGDYLYRIVVTDTAGATTDATATTAVTVTDVPSDPFGTPDLILSGTVPAIPASIDLDNIGVGTDFRLNQLNSARVQLYGDTTTRNAVGTYLANNTDSVFVVEYSDGTIIYYENNDPAPVGNKFPGAFHDIHGSTWHNEDGTSRSGPRTDLGNTIELRLYPTNEV